MKSNSQSQAVVDLLQSTPSILGGVSSNLLKLSEERPLLIVFLRHKGCTFCRETLALLKKFEPDYKKKNLFPVVVMMSDQVSADEFVSMYGFSEVQVVSDQEKKWYRAFSLGRGGLEALFGWKVLKRGIFEGALLKHGIGKIEGDSLQMPGVFVVRRGEIVNQFRYESISDVPDFEGLTSAL